MSIGTELGGQFAQTITPFTKFYFNQGVDFFMVIGVPEGVAALILMAAPIFLFILSKHFRYFAIAILLGVLGFGFLFPADPIHGGLILMFGIIGVAIAGKPNKINKRIWK